MTHSFHPPAEDRGVLRHRRTRHAGLVIDSPILSALQFGRVFHGLILPARRTPAAYQKLSDHCPVVLDLVDRDLD